MAQQVQVHTKNYVAANCSWMEEASRDGMMKEGQPRARIILEHRTPHTDFCEAVCVAHTFFLIRLLPTGHLTPVEKLAAPALINILRRQEERFFVKTYAQFEALHSELTAAQTSIPWQEEAPVLPSKYAPVARRCWRCFRAVEHNANLDQDLQHYLDTLMRWLPAGGIAQQPQLKSFFEADQVPVSHLLVQQALKAHNGDLSAEQ